MWVDAHDLHRGNSPRPCRDKSKLQGFYHFPLRLVKKWINEKKVEKTPGVETFLFSSFYHVNKANETLQAVEFPSRHLGEIQLPSVLDPQWGIHCGGLSFNLTRVAAERGHQGLHLMTAAITWAQEGKPSSYISMCKPSSTYPLIHSWLLHRLCNTSALYLRENMLPAPL